MGVSVSVSSIPKNHTSHFGSDKNSQYGAKHLSPALLEAPDEEFSAYRDKTWSKKLWEAVLTASDRQEQGRKKASQLPVHFSLFREEVLVFWLLMCNSFLRARTSAQRASNWCGEEFLTWVVVVSCEYKQRCNGGRRNVLPGGSRRPAPFSPTKY